MTRVIRPTFDQRTEATTWIASVESSDGIADCLENFPDGPLRELRSAGEATDFMLQCAEVEVADFLDDAEMDEVHLKMEFEHGSMFHDRLDLLFSYWRPDEPGSVSFSISCVKSSAKTFLVFGDDDLLPQDSH